MNENARSFPVSWSESTTGTVVYEIRQTQDMGRADVKVEARKRCRDLSERVKWKKNKAVGVREKRREELVVLAFLACLKTLNRHMSPCRERLPGNVDGPLHYDPLEARRRGCYISNPK